jgi:serine/threonine protein kinase
MCFVQISFEFRDPFLLKWTVNHRILCVMANFKCSCLVRRWYYLFSNDADIWGAGCIFVEMMNGYPCFPGVRDVFDQLDKIFRVTGTPTEETWPGVSHLPNYRYRDTHRGDLARGLTSPQLQVQGHPQRRSGLGSHIFLTVGTGTPTEDTWPGVSHLPNYRYRDTHRGYLARGLTSS